MTRAGAHTKACTAKRLLGLICQYGKPHVHPLGSGVNVLNNHAGHLPGPRLSADK
jgi:hypothetical protein